MGIKDRYRFETTLTRNLQDGLIRFGQQHQCVLYTLPVYKYHRSHTDHSCEYSAEMKFGEMGDLRQGIELKRLTAVFLYVCNDLIDSLSIIKIHR